MKYERNLHSIPTDLPIRSLHCTTIPPILRTACNDTCLARRTLRSIRPIHIWPLLGHEIPVNVLSREFGANVLRLNQALGG
jgi:hypothetical protein